MYCTEFDNHNADSHAMHLHGHSFQVTSLLGKPVGPPANSRALSLTS